MVKLINILSLYTCKMIKMKLTLNKKKAKLNN